MCWFRLDASWHFLQSVHNKVLLVHASDSLRAFTFTKPDSEDSLGLHRLSRPSFPSSPTGLRTMSPLSPTSPASEALAEACVRENRITTYRDARFRRIAGASLGAITLLSSAAVQAPHYGLVSIAFTASSYVCMQGLFHQ